MNATSKTPASSNVTPTSIRVDGARLWQSLMDLAQIGATPKGGVRRLALTDLDRQGRDLVVGWLLGGYLAATALAVIVGTVPRNGLRLAMRLGAFVAFAFLLGLAGALLTGPGYGIWAQHFGTLWLTGTLVVFSAAVLTAALESWVGLVGTGLAMLVLFVVGNPGSGGVYPPEFLPGPYRGLHAWLPTGQATDLVRAVELTGYRPKVALRDGIEKTYAWYRANVFDRAGVYVR